MSPAGEMTKMIRIERMPGTKAKVYLCHPITGMNPDLVDAIAQAGARLAFEHGYVPVTTWRMWQHVQGGVDGREYDTTLEACLEMLTACQELWVLTDYISNGMAREIERASELGLAIRFVVLDARVEVRASDRREIQLEGKPEKQLLIYGMDGRLRPPERQPEIKEETPGQAGTTAAEREVVMKNDVTAEDILKHAEPGGLREITEKYTIDGGLLQAKTLFGSETISEETFQLFSDDYKGETVPLDNPGTADFCDRKIPPGTVAVALYQSRPNGKVKTWKVLHPEHHDAIRRDALRFRHPLKNQLFRIVVLDKAQWGLTDGDES